MALAQYAIVMWMCAISARILCACACNWFKVHGIKVMWCHILIFTFRVCSAFQYSPHVVGSRSCVCGVRARVLFLCWWWLISTPNRVMMVLCAFVAYLNSVTSIEIYEGEVMWMRVQRFSRSRLLRAPPTIAPTFFADLSAFTELLNSSIGINMPVGAQKSVRTRKQTHNNEPVSKVGRIAPMPSESEQLPIWRATGDGNMRSLWMVQLKPKTARITFTHKKNSFHYRRATPLMRPTFSGSESKYHSFEQQTVTAPENQNQGEQQKWPCVCILHGPRMANNVWANSIEKHNVSNFVFSPASHPNTCTEPLRFSIYCPLGPFFMPTTWLDSKFIRLI